MRPKRCTTYIPYDGANATLGSASAVDAGAHTGNPVQQEIGSIGLVGLLMADAGDMVNMLSLVPRDVNWTQEIGVRVVYQTASATAADTIEWIVLYDLAVVGEALIVGATALDTTIQATTETVTGTAEALEYSPRGAIAKNKFTSAEVATPSFFSWNVEMNAFAVGLDEDKIFLGLLVDYMPKPGLGGASTFSAEHDQESI